MATPAPASDAPTNATGEQPQSGFVQMTDEEALYEREVMIMENRGRRLRRAGLAAAFTQIIAIVCSIYTTISIRWALIEWMQPEKTAYDIADNLGLFKVGILADTLTTITDTFTGALIGMILIGAGVNPATSAIIIVFKVIQQAIMGANVIFMIAAGLLVDENLPIYSTIQSYFYSENQPPIGVQMSYLMLLINKYGHIFAQVFAGVHLALLGFSIVAWGVFPRYLGWITFIAGPCLIVNSCLYFYWPGYDGEVAVWLSIPFAVSQFWMAGWLLVNTPHPSKNRELAMNSLWADHP